MNTMERLQKIFQDVFDDENLQISTDMNASDLEDWDSLHHITLLSAVQSEFGISFDLDEIIEMKYVDDILTAIERKSNG